jgi:flagellar biosynthesis GTPase FlhF
MRVMKTSSELDPKNLHQNLTRFAGNSSALQNYVNGLRARFDGYVEIKVIEQQVLKANVRKDLADAVIAMLRSERELQRLPHEEELKDAQIETQLLEEQAKQQDIEWRIEHEEELRELEHQYKIQKLKKKTADLNQKPVEHTPKPRPSREEQLASRLIAQKKIREQIQTEEQEELLKFRLEKRPNLAKDKQVYEDEAVWLADWREVGGDHEDFVLGEYENNKKRYRKMLNDALDELG